MSYRHPSIDLLRSHGRAGFGVDDGKFGGRPAVLDYAAWRT
jgi:hypothetical protein